MKKTCLVIITISVLFLTAYTTIEPVKSFIYNLTRPPTITEIQVNTQKIIDEMEKEAEELGCDEGTFSEMIKCSTNKKIEETNEILRELQKDEKGGFKWKLLPLLE